MEQLFNPQWPSGDRPEIQLCIFPHLPEFLVIDSRRGNPEIIVLSTDDVFDEDFYQAMEAEFSETLRSSKEFLFSHLINLPINIEETARDITMSFILDRLGVQVDDEDEIPSVVVYVVSGGALTAHSEKIREGLIGLIKNGLDPQESDRWEQTISNLINRETAITEQLNEQHMSDALSSDSLDYFTLWESRN